MCNSPARTSGRLTILPPGRYCRGCKAVPGAVDVHIHQAYDQPQLDITVDRTKAEQVGMTQSVVANNALVSLANSFQTAPNFWVSPQGVAYNVSIYADSAISHGFIRGFAGHAGDWSRHRRCSRT